MHPNLITENQRMSTRHRLDLQTLRSQPVMSKNLLDHWSATFVKFCLDEHQPVISQTQLAHV